MRLIELTALIIAFSIFTASCLQSKEEVTLTIFHAGSLSKPIEELAKAYTAKYPKVKILREGAGSLETIRKITELKREADIIAVADYELIPKMLVPEYAEWAIKFARNRMVIAYTNKSKYSQEIDQDNWYYILARKDVEIGRSNPETDPCGYRTLILLSLAEKYYGRELKEDILENSPPRNMRYTEVDLVSTLQLGEIDYLFIYESNAVQYGLKYIKLPAEIDLSSEEHAAFYSTEKINVKRGSEIITLTGKPIIYGITVPKNSLNSKVAIDFLRFLLSSEGRGILQKNGMQCLAIASDVNKIPLELKPYIGVESDNYED
ncbi:MAG: tungstate ABC transporter substrate-binding protein WtpA [Methanocellales archaeon]